MDEHYLKTTTQDKNEYIIAKKYQHKEDWDEYKNLKWKSNGIMHQQHKQYLSNLIDSQDNSNNLKHFRIMLKVSAITMLESGH